jgi:hypothetical protein
LTKGVYVFEQNLHGHREQRYVIEFTKGVYVFQTAPELAEEAMDVYDF